MKKVFGVRPEKAADGRTPLEQALHFADQSTFAIDAHITSANVLKTPDGPQPGGEVITDRELAALQASRQTYAEHVDGHVAFNAQQRQANTGALPSGFAPPKAAPAACALGDVYKTLITSKR